MPTSTSSPHRAFQSGRTARANSAELLVSSERFIRSGVTGHGSRHTRALASFLISGICLFAGSSAWAFCPSYTASSAHNTYNCAIEAAPGTNPTVAQWSVIFDIVANGPSSWGTQGPSQGTIAQGCNNPQTTTQVEPKFPCELLKAIAMRESGWRQFCVPDRPADQVGGASRTIISFDCGYGIGQVTSGMHVGESPTFDRARVASEPTYNLATGTRILADKWRYVKCVGDRLPWLIEHWYSATWAYNGLSYPNNPTNPAYESDRGVWNPSVGGSAPYQELIFGYLEHPPTAAHWTGVPAAYPALGEIGGAGSPNPLSEPQCASPTDCVNKRPVHRSICFPLPDAGTDVDAGTEDAGVEEVDAGSDAGSEETDAGVDGGFVGDGDPTIPGGDQTPDAGEERFGASTQLIQQSTGCGCNGAAGPMASALVFLAVWTALRRLQRPPS